MDNNQLPGHGGLMCLGFAGFGKCLSLLADAHNIQILGGWVTIIGGSLAAIHYLLLILEKLLKLKKR